MMDKGSAPQLPINEYMQKLYDARDRASLASDKIKAAEKLRSMKRAEEAKKKSATVSFRD